MSESADLNALIDQARSEIEQCVDLAVLDQIRVRLLGKKGEITERLKALGAMDPETRRAAGATINAAKDQIAAALGDRKAALEAQELAERLAKDSLDVTLPGRGQTPGGLHPVTRARRRIEQIFRQAGFIVADGPEIEDDWHNFEALNIPADHPARAMHDTFYFPDGRLLRTHTSPVQIRAMQTQSPPLKIISPGRVYRCDSDMTHTPMFHQVEGLVVDEGISFANLKAALQSFLQAFFEASVSIRLRPSYFPFTEPSAEFDIQRPDGSWIELGGCGMVHPNVLRAGGLDPEEWSGFAFGFGIDRMARERHGIDDIRDMYSNDIRFIEQF